MQITLSSFWLIFLIAANILGIFSSIIIKFNDVKHLKSKVKWICNQLEKIKDEQVEQGKDISALKTKTGI